MIAALPMYDWPEVRDATDALWTDIRSALAEEGIDAPDRLDRISPSEDALNSSHLLISQTCGLPFITKHSENLTVIGSFHFDLNCQPGDYYSVVLIRGDCQQDQPSADLSDQRGLVVAFNELGSQSGDAALRHLIAPLANGGAFFDHAIETSSHRRSIRAVAEGQADLCCVDAVSWLLARSHEPAARGLRVKLVTPSSPGLPLVIAKHNEKDAPAFRRAVSTAVSRLDPDAMRSLHLLGFRHRSAKDYNVLANRVQQAASLGYPVLR